MALSIDEYKGRLAEINAVNSAKATEQQAARRGVAITMRELLADPRWEVYVQHLSALSQGHESQVASLTQKLTGGLSHDEYTKTVTDLAFYRGYVQACKQAMELASNLVKQSTPDKGS